MVADTCPVRESRQLNSLKMVPPHPSNLSATRAVPGSGEGSFVCLLWKRSEPCPCGYAVTTTDPSLHSGPSTSNQVLRVMSQGSKVQITATV